MKNLAPLLENGLRKLYVSQQPSKKKLNYLIQIGIKIYNQPLKFLSFSLNSLFPIQTLSESEKVPQVGEASDHNIFSPLKNVRI